MSPTRDGVEIKLSCCGVDELHIRRCGRNVGPAAQRGHRRHQELPLRRHSRDRHHGRQQGLLYHNNTVLDKLPSIAIEDRGQTDRVSISGRNPNLNPNP